MQKPGFGFLIKRYLSYPFSAPGATKLHTLISKLKKWIKIMELKIRSLPRYAFFHPELGTPL